MNTDLTTAPTALTAKLPDDWSEGYESAHGDRPARTGTTLLGFPLEGMTWHGRSIAALRRRGVLLAVNSPAIATASRASMGAFAGGGRSARPLCVA